MGLKITNCDLKRWASIASWRVTWNMRHVLSHHCPFLSPEKNPAHTFGARSGISYDPTLTWHDDLLAEPRRRLPKRGDA